MLHERAARIMSDVETLGRELRALGSERDDHVVLGVPPTLMLLLGPNLLIDARADMPGVHLSLVEERSVVLLEALERGQINIAFAWNVQERSGVERTALLEEDLLLVTAPAEAGGSGPISLAEALTHDLAIAGERGVIRNIVQSEARRLSLPLKLAFEVHSVSAMKALIARNGAATIMPYSLAPRELSAGELTGRKIDRPTLTRTLYAVRPARGPAFSHEVDIQRFLAGVVEKALAAMGPHARALR